MGPLNIIRQVFLICLALRVAAEDGEQQVTAATASPVKKLEPDVPATPPNTLPADVSILKQINKVNDDGSYTFGYEASDGSFKVETRDVAGNVKGMFGFVDETGQLKRVSYSASNSSGFQTSGASTTPADYETASTGKPSTVQVIPNKEEEPKTSGLKKILVSKRPVNEQTNGRREGNDLRRQLPRNENDSPDVYGVHGRSSLQSAPVSPVISALMSELDPVRVQYRPPPSVYNKAGQTAPFQRAKYEEHERMGRPIDEDDDNDVNEPVTAPAGQTPLPSSTQYQPVPLQYQQSYPLQYPQPVYPVMNPYSFNPNTLIALRDDLMELILTLVQTRISQLPLGNVGGGGGLGGPYQPYPLPYQQPYYVPNYYQGPRLQPRPLAAGNVQFSGQQDSLTRSPRVTQTFKDGLIRMLLTTSPRYSGNTDVDVEEQTAPRSMFRRTTQSTPVRNVQIISDDNSVDNRPVTTESSD
ncbi:uncharacterized protein LOC126838367 [Adelges cooleyi]|uniref:uncharacterized protein LOC126838367 n=1 Tax=Adelges cooleyi TaxID=133065 RepID=UPI00217F5520|nr:uncharacterized protein LOC126838367 [Adelges cooleyi]